MYIYTHNIVTVLLIQNIVGATVAQAGRPPTGGSAVRSLAPPVEVSTGKTLIRKLPPMYNRSMCVCKGECGHSEKRFDWSITLEKAYNICMYR